MGRKRGKVCLVFMFPRSSNANFSNFQLEFFWENPRRNYFCQKSVSFWNWFGVYSINLLRAPLTEMIAVRLLLLLKCLNVLSIKFNCMEFQYRLAYVKINTGKLFFCPFLFQTHQTCHVAFWLFSVLPYTSFLQLLIHIQSIWKCLFKQHDF